MVISDDVYGGTCPNTACLSGRLPKNNARPTISDSKSPHYSQNQNSGEGSRQTCPSSSAPASYTDKKHLLVLFHWLSEVTVVNKEILLVVSAVRYHRRRVQRICGIPSKDRQLPLEDEQNHCTVVMQLLVFPLHIFKWILFDSSIAI